MARAGRAAALGDVTCEERAEAGDDGGIFGVDVVRFGGIGGEIVELNLGEAGLACGGIEGSGPTAGAGAEGEFPGALAEGKQALD